MFIWKPIEKQNKLTQINKDIIKNIGMLGWKTCMLFMQAHAKTPPDLLNNEQMDKLLKAEQALQDLSAEFGEEMAIRVKTGFRNYRN